MKHVVLVDAVRTPIGKYRGALARVRPDDMAATLLKSLSSRNNSILPDEVILGDTNQAGEDNRNIARMASLLAGFPFEVTGVTVNRLCGSGLEAIVQAARAIALGDADVVMAGGVESMSRAPYAMPKAHEPFPRRPPKVYDTSLGWRFPNPKLEERIPLISMGMTAENVAEKHRISRVDQDAFALRSHKKADAAWKAKAFSDEIVPIKVPPASKRDAPTTFERDESIRPTSTPEAMAKLKTVFKENGSVTAGNSSPLNDGASVVLVASEEYAKANGLVPIARFRSSAVAGVDPSYMGIGPIPATQQALKRVDWTVSDLDIVELNEAFAAQSLACIRELELDESIVNQRGGAIALGHPIGCSGARIVTTLIHQMKANENLRRGLAALCIGVGQGIAMTLERA